MAGPCGRHALCQVTALHAWAAMQADHGPSISVLVAWSDNLSMTDPLWHLLACSITAGCTAASHHAWPLAACASSSRYMHVCLLAATRVLPYQTAMVWAEDGVLHQPLVLDILDTLLPPGGSVAALPSRPTMDCHGHRPEAAPGVVEVQLAAVKHQVHVHAREVVRGIPNVEPAIAHPGSPGITLRTWPKRHAYRTHLPRRVQMCFSRGAMPAHDWVAHNTHVKALACLYAHPIRQAIRNVNPLPHG